MKLCVETMASTAELPECGLYLHVMQPIGREQEARRYFELAKMVEEMRDELEEEVQFRRNFGLPEVISIEDARTRAMMPWADVGGGETERMLLWVLELCLLKR